MPTFINCSQPSEHPGSRSVRWISCGSVQMSNVRILLPTKSSGTGRFKAATPFFAPRPSPGDLVPSSCKYSHEKSPKTTQDTSSAGVLQNKKINPESQLRGQRYHETPSKKRHAYFTLDLVVEKGKDLLRFLRAAFVRPRQSSAFPSRRIRMAMCRYP